MRPRRGWTQARLLRRLVAQLLCLQAQALRLLAQLHGLASHSLCTVSLLRGAPRLAARRRPIDPACGRRLTECLAKDLAWFLRIRLGQ